MALRQRHFGPLGVSWASGTSPIMPVRALASRAIRIGNRPRPGAAEGTRSLLRRLQSDRHDWAMVDVHAGGPHP
jgi:hypothetical protein